MYSKQERRRWAGRCDAALNQASLRGAPGQGRVSGGKPYTSGPAYQVAPRPGTAPCQAGRAVPSRMAWAPGAHWARARPVWKPAVGRRTGTAGGDGPRPPGAGRAGGRAGFAGRARARAGRPAGAKDASISLPGVAETSLDLGVGGRRPPRKTRPADHPAPVQRWGPPGVRRAATGGVVLVLKPPPPATAHLLSFFFP